ncbi:MAG: tRNA (N6-threonylcarbamoyladenosine(37)-N6)-methyltransferase TrmO [Parasporobacterium sp.]|nr:tRNA (N6-threonylcarbamoyladenosine(37)-N6)-methyltransferase TrmO [Parasporobacterium sp.]
MSNDSYTIKPIARIYTDYNEKFGIPRQPGLIDDLYGRIVFEPAFRDEDAIRCIEQFSHIWLVWGFSETRIDMEAERPKWSPLISPPMLGGKTQVGVWASRSPYRPNSLGLSSVELVSVNVDADGPVLIVKGADIMSGTPIYDIKPYIPYSDSHPEASEGYSVKETDFLEVDFPEDLRTLIAPDKINGLIKVLKQDPRGAYEKEPGHVYGLSFHTYDIKFTVEDRILKVFAVETLSSGINHIK